MKSKAELVVELDKMTKVRDELTQELLNLSAQLEQERSKVNQLTLDVKKAHVSTLIKFLFFYLFIFFINDLCNILVLIQILVNFIFLSTLFVFYLCLFFRLNPSINVISTYLHFSLLEWFTVYLSGWL